MISDHLDLSSESPSGSGPFPNFCAAEILLRVFVLVGLLALAVAGLVAKNDSLDVFSGVLMFAFAAAMISLLTLCLLQRHLAKLRFAWQMMISVIIPPAATWLVHLAVSEIGLAAAENRLRIVAVALVLSLVVMQYVYLMAAWRREIKTVAQAREKALRARVRPHFLYNSMNSIASLCRTDPGRAEQIALDLSDLFRAAFALESSHTLESELSLVRAYLDIEQARFGDRLKVYWDVPRQVKYVAGNVPALFLLPLVENTIQHGIAPSARPGSVWIKVSLGRYTVRIELRNTFDGDGGQGTHTAGEEARVRLRELFGDKARVVVNENTETYQVDVILPLFCEVV